MPQDDSGPDAWEGELVRQARRGDDSAFEALVNRHARRLYALAFHLLGNAADAEDALQDAFIGAFGGLHGFRGEASVKTWLTRILVNTSAKFRRSRRLRRAKPIDPDLESGGGLGAGAATAEVRADIRMDVSAALASLSEEHRNVIFLREMDGMTYKEIAEVLKVPRGTVESRLFRARQALKELLGGYLP